MLTSVNEVINSLPIKLGSKALIIGKGFLRYVNQLENALGKNNLVLLNIGTNNKQNIFSKDIKSISYKVDSGAQMPFKDKLYDVLIISHALRYIIYRESFLKECMRILKPGGLIVVIESNVNAFGTVAHPDAKIIFDDMLEYLDRAGFLLGENFDTSLHEYGIIGVCPLHNSE